VIPLDPEYPLEWISEEEVIERITRLVARMHALGYGHGDLHMDNIGYDQNGNFYILDHDRSAIMTRSIQ
jgi:tRNA A-37 threonylcarbamoyl transferase component Bud32